MIKMNLVKEAGYSAFDVMTFGKGIERRISGFCLRLPTRYYKYFPSNYEEENFSFLKSNCSEGHVVIDVGAHIGLFSVCAAQLTGANGKVYAFEPAPKTNALLKKTISINHKESIVEPRSEAVAEKEGTTFFYVSDVDGDNSNSLVQYRQDKNLGRVEVKITSIDNFLKRKGISEVAFIKIDAEGSEYRVLKGATETFQKLRPYAILALHPAGILGNGDSLQLIYEFLTQLNYKVIYNGSILSKEEFCSKKDLFDVQLIPI
jgi:FkbM family methyltransferase